MYCPDNAIDGDLNADLIFCKGCGICTNECPKKAIEMVREEK
jgi:pyruvate ferredoxin oxidoreductase delta subunit